MRSAVDAILQWHKTVRSPDLPRKLEKMSETAFRFFRGTFFLYAQDLKGEFGRVKPLAESGRIVGDLHTENYGTFRAVTGDVVYDINDFDETTVAPYEYDVRRLAVGLVLAAEENGHRFGDGLNAAEFAIRAWIDSLHRWYGVSRKKFASIEATHPARQLLGSARIADRVEFLKTLVVQDEGYGFVIRPSKEFSDVSKEEKRRIAEAVPFFFQHCTAPKAAQLVKYKLLHVMHRVAGNGSLGRVRYALLFDNGRAKHPGWEHLRLIEWKQSLDSALDASRPEAGRKRAENVYAAETAFQLFPKRYLGHTRIGKMPMQGREIGANDARFKHADFQELEAFDSAATMFGQILARNHLLGARPSDAPGAIPARIGERLDRYVNSVLRFAASYSDQVCTDHDELKRRQGEVAKAWKQ